MPSRRAFLTGGAAAAAVAGGAGVLSVGPRRALHLVGLDRSPDHRVPPSGWPVQQRTLTSAAMRAEVPWAMSTDPAGTAGIVICLHGRNNDHLHVFDRIHLHDVVADTGGGLAVVSVYGGAASYWHPRRDGTNALALVLDELIPTATDELGATLPVAVMGWSMGGYGALLAAERAMERFVAVAACSPALWRSFGESSDGAFDDGADFASYDVFSNLAALVGQTVRIDCGTGDGFVGAARAFADAMPVPNQGRFSHGYHDVRYSRSVAPHALATIRSAMGLATAPG